MFYEQNLNIVPQKTFIFTILTKVKPLKPVFPNVLLLINNCHGPSDFNKCSWTYFSQNNDSILMFLSKLNKSFFEVIN